MGRIDEALRRADLDVSRGTGAPAPAPLPSPWHFEAPDGTEAARSAAPAMREPSVASAGRHLPAADGPGPRWDDLDVPVAERLVVWKNAPPLHVEQFRSLAATLLSAQRERPLRSLILTSAAPGDGKSHVAVNLALTLSESYHLRVLLIDADLRRPSLHARFGIHNGRGLAEALHARVDEKLAAVELSERLTLLPAGRPMANPLSGLSSERMKRIVADATSSFDWVIVDSPPVGLLADARLVSESVDGAILVVRAGATRFQDLRAAADLVGAERILGVVLNAVDLGEIRGQGYYHHYYHGHIGKTG